VHCSFAVGFSTKPHESSSDDGREGKFFSKINPLHTILAVNGGSISGINSFKNFSVFLWARDKDKHEVFLSPVFF
jgi:hypothetical protein